jgi:hypothetical protein
MLFVPYSFLKHDPFDADTTAFIARTTGLNPATKVALDAFIKGLKNDGIWNNVDFINLLLPSDTLAHAEANTLLNIRQNVFNSVKVGVSYTFSQTTGFDFAGSSTYLKNGWYSHSTPGSNGEVMRPDKQHIVCYIVNSYDTNPFNGNGWCGYLKGIN